MRTFNDHIGRILKAHHFYEADLLRAIADQNPQGLAVDVGAFIGTHTCWFQTLPGVRQVIAIEPNPAACELLRANAPDACIIQAAVHSTWVECAYQPGPADNVGMGKIIPGVGVRCVRLDDVVSGIVGLIKVDVEGTELEVLESGRATILRDLPLLSLEQVPTLPGWLQPHYRLLGQYCATPTFLWGAG